MRSYLNFAWLWRWLPATWHDSLGAGLRRLGLKESRPPSNKDGSLGLDLLPDGLGQLPVESPVALLWQDRPADVAWINALLVDNLKSGPVFLLVDDDVWVDRLLKKPALSDAYTLGHLTVWLLRQPLPKGRPSALLHEVLAELHHVGLCDRQALFAVLSPSTGFEYDVAQIKQWGNQIRNFCQNRKRPLVFGFKHFSDVDAVLNPLQSISDVFQHVATLGTEAGRHMLYAQVWNGDHGAIFKTSFGLKFDESSGRLSYDGSQIHGQDQRLVEAPDQYLVIATRDVVAGQHGVPPEWVLVANAKELLDTTHSAVAATVLVHCGPATQQMDLLYLVHLLRLQHPHTLKIVMRESHEKLRANVEQAFLHLGANKVVYREIGFSRLVRQLVDMNDEIYTHQVNPDFDSALAEFMPDTLRGYLPAPQFCAAVQSMLARTSQMGLVHSLVRLTMQAHVAHLDALLACQANRDGDIITADQNALYVFMFSCAEPDIDPALQRMFTLSTSELFTTQVSDNSPEGIRTMVQSLVNQALPDYSLQLMRLAPGTAASTRYPAPTLTTELDAGAVQPNALSTTILSVTPVQPVTVQSKPIACLVPSNAKGAYAV